MYSFLLYGTHAYRPVTGFYSAHNGKVGPLQCGMKTPMAHLCTDTAKYHTTENGAEGTPAFVGTRISFSDFFFTRVYL